MKRNILFIISLLLLAFVLTGCDDVRNPSTPEYKLAIFNNRFGITEFNDDYYTENLVIEEEITYYCEKHKKNETRYVTDILSNAFQNKGLKSVTIHGTENSVFYGILRYAFADNQDLAEVNLPHNITSISDFAFANNPSLETIDLHNVEYLDEGVFLNNTNLQLIHIGNEIRSIGDNAFENCHDDLIITMGNLTPPEMGWNVFKGVDNYKILVPRELLQDYKSASGWASFAPHIFAQEDN